MKINLFFEETETFQKPKHLKENVELLIEREKRIPGEINLIFCSDDYLLKMNIEYLGHDYYTDVLTFDYSEQNIISGDIFISTDRIKENAALYSIDFMNEMFRIIIHGILHLIGYDDKKEKDKKEMTDKEDFYLNEIFDPKQSL